MKKLILSLVAMLSLMGCSFLEEKEPVAELTTRYATMKFVSQAPEAEQNARSCRVHAVVSEARGFLAGDGVSVAALADAVKAKLPRGMDVADQFLVLSLIDMVAADLNAKVGEGVLDPDSKLYVNKVLGWVESSVVCL